MISRRNVVKGNLAALLSRAGFSSQPNGGTSDDGSGSSPVGDYWNDWPDYLSHLTNVAREKRKAVLASIQTKEQVRKRRATILARVWESIGGQLERTPLNARTVGKIQRNGYAIEKIIFESQPGVYVSANLYLPADASRPSPAVLSPLGHYPEGKSARNYQHLFQNLARKGYAVFTFDPWGQGERQQFLDPVTGRSRYADPTQQHDKAGWPMVLLGATLAQHRVWDAVRALDYLESRPEIDTTRVGCVGHSGGATMTMFLCALEPRLRTAVMVEGHFRNFSHAHYDPPGGIGDAEQNLVGSLNSLIDKGDLIWAFAPRPALMCYTPEDGLSWVTPYYVESVHEIFEEAKAAYRILDAPESIQLFASFLPHNYDFFNRRETYRWLNRWLAQKDPGIEETEFDSSSPDALNCTTTGQVLTSLGGRSIVRVNADRASSLAVNRKPVTASSYMRVRSRLPDLLSIPPKRSPLKVRILAARTQRDLDIQKFEFRSEPQIRIPGWFLTPHRKGGRLPVILFITAHGKDELLDEANEMQTIARNGFAVCAVDLRGFGATSPRFPLAARNLYRDAGASLDTCYSTASLVLGKPVLGQRVWDFIRCLDYLETRSDIDMARVYVWGVAEAGLSVLIGSAIDNRPRSILCERIITDFHSVLESSDYSAELSWFASGLLKEFDLPEIMAAVAPRSLWALNPVGPQNETLPESAIRVRFEPVTRSYSNLNSPERFCVILDSGNDRANVASNWLKTT